MRVLIVTGIFPPDIGGPATYVPHMAEALVKQGHCCTVVTLSAPHGTCPVSDDSVYPFRVVRFSRQRWKPWRWTVTMLAIWRFGRQADVLFVQGLALEAVLSNLILRKPLVHKVVGDVVWERAINRGWVRTRFDDFQMRYYNLRIEILKALRTWWTRQADKIIVPSRYLARCVVNWGVPKEQIEVVHNAFISLDHASRLGEGARPDALPACEEGTVTLVTVGRLVPWKHVDFIIEAVARLENVRLLVIGDGPERSYLEGVSQILEVSHRVYFAGQRSQRETLDLMAVCDLFVLHSTYEGLPHVVLEAMALGLPVLATAVGGVSEVVQDGDNGRLVPPLDRGEFHMTLSKLVSSPFERQRLARGARRTVEVFSFERMVARTEAILRGTLPDHAAR